jgi:hypothetical protein
MLIIRYGYSFSKFYPPPIIAFSYEKLKEASGRSRFYPMGAWPRFEPKTFEHKING